jgi:dUTP pyrophosphatase
MSESEPEFYLSDLEEDLLFEYNKFMRLKIFVDSIDNELKQKYEESINQHHLKLNKNIHHIDAGFDLFSPETKQISSINVNKLDYKIICSAEIVRHNNSSYNTGFYMYPRSSISKSNLRLANNIGIIDAGYRGHLMGMFDVIYVNETTVNKFDRHLQICAPGLMPITVEIVNSIEELGEKTARCDGGFGSTGV